LKTQSYSEFETIVVDNGSTDGSQDYIRENFPEVILLELEENLGFTGACNAGFKIASGEYIVLLNNDTEVDSNWIAAIVDSFDGDEQVGIVASKIMLFDQRDHFHSAGDVYFFDGTPGNRGVWQEDIGQYDQPELVFSACGAAAAYRRSLIDDIGFLDEDLYFSCEDVDMGWRTQLAGWKVLYCPQAIVYHKLKATGGSVVGSYYDGRNFLFLLWKHYPSSLWRVHWKDVIKSQLIISWQAIRSWRGEAARARLRGQIAGLFGFYKMYRKRHLLRSTRRIDDNQLTKVLTPVDDSRTPK
jgi:GT2 family glycosyltransferase